MNSWNFLYIVDSFNPLHATNKINSSGTHYVLNIVDFWWYLTITQINNFDHILTLKIYALYTAIFCRMAPSGLVGVKNLFMKLHCRK